MVLSAFHGRVQGTVPASIQALTGAQQQITTTTRLHLMSSDCLRGVTQAPVVFLHRHRNAFT